MDKMRIIVLTTLFVLLVFGLLTAGLYYLTTLISIITLRIIVVLLIYGTITAIPLSYYLGHSEARGFLRGADKIMDSTLGKTIDMMEQKAKVQKQAEQQPMLMLPMHPRTQFPPELRAGARRSTLSYPPEEGEEL